MAQPRREGAFLARIRLDPYATAPEVAAAMTAQQQMEQFAAEQGIMEWRIVNAETQPRGNTLEWLVHYAYLLPEPAAESAVVPEPALDELQRPVQAILAARPVAAMVGGA